jgi:hypothetical protein
MKHRLNIIDVQGTIVAHVGVLTRAQIQQNLQDEAAAMKLRKGRNYWYADKQQLRPDKKQACFRS